MSTHLLLIRHAETLWNREQRVQGNSDVPLSGEGHTQALRLARRLASCRPDALYTSDLSRAQQTAAPIARLCGLTPVPLPGLRELDLGEWEGLLVSEVIARWPDLFQQWRGQFNAVRPPGGETDLELVERVTAAGRRITAENAGRRVAIVGHGGSVRVLVAWLLGLPWEACDAFAVSSASLTAVRVGDDLPVLETLNSTYHLHFGRRPSHGP